MEEIFETLKAIVAHGENPIGNELGMDGLSFMHLVKHEFIIPNDMDSKFELTGKGFKLLLEMDSLSKHLKE